VNYDRITIIGMRTQLTYTLTHAQKNNYHFEKGKGKVPVL